MGRRYKSDKPYTLVVSEWAKKQITYSVEDKDTLEECLADIEMMRELNEGLPRPVRNEVHPAKAGWRANREVVCKNRLEHCQKFYDFPEGAKFWGYLLLDNVNETIKVGFDGIMGTVAKPHDLALKDAWFRKEGEVPDKYVWDEGEYEGWLKFRFGDGTNALDYEEKHPHKSNKKDEDKETIIDTPVTEEEMIQDYYDDLQDKEMVRLKIDRW